MKSNAATPDAYLAEQEDEKSEMLVILRNTILKHLPVGFTETMQYGMISYVVPLSLYPKGYHAGKNQPLPFISIAAQKNFVAFYHMGIYADNSLMDWFLSEYSKFNNQKLDMGKSCIRFKKAQQIPFDLLGELVSKIAVNQWIEMYEQKLVPK